MRRKFRSLKLGLAACLFALPAFGNLAAQTKSASDPLTGFERSIKRGDVAEIERPLLAYAVAHPNDARALELLASVRFRQARLTEAKSLYQRALTLDPNRISAQINLGRLAYALGQKDEARRILNRVAGQSVGSTAAQIELATALFFVRELQKSLSIAEKLPLKAKNNEALSLIAAIHLESGNRRKLIDLIPLMKKAAAANPRLALQLAEVLQNAGMNGEAVGVLRGALASAPGDPAVLTQLGRAEIAARDFAAAERHLAQASKLQPDSAEILAARAMLENARGNFPAALELLTEARRRAPDSTVILADFVVAAMRSNRTRDAVEAAKKLVVLNSENAEYQYLLGAALLQNGNAIGAQDILENYMQRRPTDSRGCLALGLALAAQRDKIENARAQLNRCLEIEPRNYEAKYQLGLSYKTLGETATAIRFFEETVALAPDYAPALRDLGALYLQTGMEAKAQTALEKSVAINANDADTHFQLSRLYNLSGRSELAKKHLELFQKIRNGGKVSP